MVVGLKTFFFKGKNLLIQFSNRINGNTKLKVVKTLKDDVISRLITKMIDLRPTRLIIQKYLEYLGFQIYNI